MSGFVTEDGYDGYSDFKTPTRIQLGDDLYSIIVTGDFDKYDGNHDLDLCVMKNGGEVKSWRGGDILDIVDEMADLIERSSQAKLQDQTIHIHDAVTRVAFGNPHAGYDYSDAPWFNQDINTDNEKSWFTPTGELKKGAWNHDVINANPEYKKMHDQYIQDRIEEMNQN